MNRRGDPIGTEYSAIEMGGPNDFPSFEGALSLARWLGNDVMPGQAADMLMRGTAGPAIEQRRAQIEEERRNRRLTGPQAMAELMEKRFAPDPPEYL